MHRVRDPEALEELIDEIVHMIRSQILAITANIVAVVSTMLAIDVVMFYGFGHHLLTEEKSLHTIKSMLFGLPILLYASFTGVLLCFSSICAGWADNWWVYRKMPEAFESNRRLVYILGAERTKRFSDFLKHNISGFAGNISFGFMLGLIPAFCKFLGVGLDIRHVTLSSASVAVAAVNFGSDVWTSIAFWSAVAGVLSVGALNLIVSFSLAMVIAIRARRVEAPERDLIYSALWRRFKTKPMSFIRSQE
jgi:site-specific recombinase